MSEVVNLDAYTALAKQDEADNSPLSGLGSLLQPKQLPPPSPGEEVSFINQVPCPTATISIAKEKPEHRIVMFLKAQGYSNREICRMMNFSDAWVSQLVRQEWFQRRLVKELNESGRDSVEAILQGEVRDSIQTLVEIRDSPLAKNSDRATCAMNILDRVLGKPIQRNETRLEVTKNKDAEIEAIDNEIAEIERSLGGDPLKDKYAGLV